MLQSRFTIFVLVLGFFGNAQALPPWPSEVKPEQKTSILSEAERETLKAEIKKDLKAELQAPEKTWQQDTEPRLNFLEINGYLRTRMDVFNRCDLGTYIPGLEMGTSRCQPPISYFSGPADAGPDQRASWLVSSNMRLRLEPTLNVSEYIRVHAMADVFDNLVFGSTPTYMSGIDIPGSPVAPYSFLSLSQSPIQGFNTPVGPINIKRAWGEVTTPVGEFRFGRMPLHFGLGVLYNSGNLINNDYGDNVDGIMFATRVAGHYLVPGATVSYAGVNERAGGFGKLGDNGITYIPTESGARYDLDPSDNVYSFFLTFTKKDKDIDAKAMLDQGDVVFNYGLLSSYRFQIYDSMFYKLMPNVQESELQKMFTRRDAHVGYLSFWSDVRWDKLRVESELVGIFGHVGNSKGLWMAQADKDRNDPLWIMQGGAAIRSRYGFLRDRLEVGLDGGWASGDPASGYGIRPGLNGNPQPGDAEGQQFNANDHTISNFKFSPDYRVDMVLFREVLGTVSDAFYVRPHVGYNFTETFGIRGDVISSFSNFASSTTGNSKVLGLELDASLFYHTEDGFYLNAQYGFLIPFAGLNHRPERVNNQDLYSKFGTAKTASALQIFFGIAF